MKRVITFTLQTEEETKQFAQKLATCLKSPLVLGFSGNIGAGKTTLIRAMLRSLGIQSAIKSPTFSLVESYQINERMIHHFDLYRIQDIDELEHIGIRDYFAEEAISCIEWPEHGGELVNHLDAIISLHIKDASRVLELESIQRSGDQLINNLGRLI